jgi:hypothetical protein
VGPDSSEDSSVNVVLVHTAATCASEHVHSCVYTCELSWRDLSLDVSGHVWDYFCELDHTVKAPLQMWCSSQPKHLFKALLGLQIASRMTQGPGLRPGRPLLSQGEVQIRATVDK